MLEKDVKEIYLSEINSVPLLTAEEEKSLALKSLKGDKASRDKLINANLRFVVKVAYKYKGYGLDIEELISEGNTGLITAAEKFDPNNNSRFTTYAVWWIQANIQKAIRETSKGIKFPAYKFEEMKDEKWNISSLDKPIGKEDDATVGDLLWDDKYDSPEVQFFDSVTEDQVWYAMEVLSEKEQRILTLRYGLDGEKPMSLSEVGVVIGLTKERIRQIEKRAFATMKSFLGRNCYYDLAA